MFYCSMSTAAVSDCHAHIHQTYYVGLSATYIYNTGKRQAQEKPPMVINMLLQCTRVLWVVAWPIRGMGGVQQQCQTLFWLSGWTETGATRVQSRSPHWHKRLMYSFASPSGHKRAVDSRPESRQMLAILKQRDYCKSHRCHLSEQQDTCPPFSYVLLDCLMFSLIRYPLSSWQVMREILRRMLNKSRSSWCTTPEFVCRCVWSTRMALPQEFLSAQVGFVLLYGV